MAARTVLVLTALCMLARPGVSQEVVVPILIGDLFANGSPVKGTIQIRLEGQDSSLVATTYTLGSSRFTFHDIQLILAQNYHLLVREPGYKELRYELNMNDFVRDSATASTYHFAGIITLNIESLPQGKGNQKTGPKAVDARQLKAEISQAARRQYNEGLEKIAAGDAKAALKHLEKAVEIAPEFYDALNKLGSEYLKSGQYRKAESILERASTIDPNDPLPLTNLGILHFQEGEAEAAHQDPAFNAGEAFRKSVEAFEKALRLNPLSPQANFHLGNALYKVVEYERAESVLLHTLDLDGRMHEARLVLLNIYTRQKRYEPALKQISAYLQSNPNSPERERLEKLRAQLQNAVKQ